jgi:tetratricopeptide (TPR) repeat protein
MTRARAAPLLAALAALAIAWPAVRNGWVDYDEGCYSRGTFLLLRSVAPSNLLRLMTSAGPGYQHQPVTYLSHAIDHALFGESVHAFHAVDVALYALLTALVASFALGVARDLPALRPRASLVAFGAGLLFAAHPVHVENYAWLGDRKDTLATLACVAALLLDRRARRATSGAARLRACALLVFAAGLGAKVAGMGLGLLVALDALLDPRQPEGARRRLLRAALAGSGYLVLAVVGAGLWLHGQRGFPMPLGGQVQGPPLLDRALYAARCLGHYVRVLVAPVGLSVQYYPHQTLLAWARDLGPLVVAAPVAALAARRPGTTRALVALGAAWLLIGLAPVLNVVFLGFVNDRYLLLPSVGVAVAAAGLVARSRRPEALAAALVVIAALTVASQAKVRDWASATTLWAATVRVDPQNPNGRVGLAAARLATGDREGAAAEVEAARALVPDHHMLARFDQVLKDEEPVVPKDVVGGATAELAAQALARGELDRATELAQGALRVYPKHCGAMTVLGKARLERGDPRGALELLAYAAHHLADADSTYHAALAAQRAGDLEQAALHLEVVERAGATWQTRLLAAQVARDAGRPAEALEAARAARRLLPRLGPEAGQGVAEVGVGLASLGALAEALALLSEHRAAGRAKPGELYDLARVEALLGRRGDAAAHLREAVAADAALRTRAAGDPALADLIAR